MVTTTGSMEAPELYGLPPERFTAARNELVKAMRAAGRREEASGVARLRKPPATAWAINQVARQSPDVVSAVFGAGSRLRAAMEDALRGDASGVRAARAAERDAVRAAVAAAGHHLVDAGHSVTDAARRRIESSLRAAMVDDSVAERLRQGVLDSDEDAPGFGFENSAPFVAESVKDEVVQAKDGRQRQSAAADQAAADQAAADQAAADQAAADQAAALRAELAAEANRLTVRAEELDAAARDAEAIALQARQAAEEAGAKAAEARNRVEELQVDGD